MIITRQKELGSLLSAVSAEKKLFLIGCSLCATTCGTGGEKDLDKLGKKLEEKGKTIVGKSVLEPACNVLEVKRFSRNLFADIEESEAILSMSCGGGTQALSEFFPDKKIISCNDTLFQGEITKMTPKGGTFEQKCSLCGDCTLDETAGICPVTRCAKGLKNGPCGGVKNGKCETDPDKPCIWLDIYERLKERGETSMLSEVRPPRDYSKNKAAQKLEVKK